MMNNAVNEESFHERSLDFESVTKWSTQEVASWLRLKGHNEEHIQLLCTQQRIDGKSLLLLTETDLRQPPIQILVLGDLKRLYFDILELQQLCSLTHHAGYGSGGGCAPPFLFFPTAVSSSSPNYEPECLGQGQGSSFSQHNCSLHSHNNQQRRARRKKRRVSFVESASSQLSDEFEEEDHESSSGADNTKPKVSASNTSNHAMHQHQHSYQRRPGGYAVTLEPEFGKALTAMAYVFVVTWLTALAMVIVHDRVPDMEKFPPLPDLFLDNMPHIPWAFEMCEVTGTILFCVWLGVLFFHKHRFILIRRFFALSGTVFLLRCVTMLITSLSVPGAHLKCQARVTPYGDWFSRLYNAYLIWKGAGLSIQGVRTCGDYMFSGHTVALTMLNFFITEYTTRRYYFIHTFSWVLNMFGIFFILAAHEHYSIDVFIAFYITSRLFLYYHTLANNHALMHRDSKRTKVWFPLFSFFESKVDGIVPNQYEWPVTPRRIKKWTIMTVHVMESKWKEMIPNPNEGFLRTKLFFKPVKKDE